MALFKSIFGKKNEDDDGQQEYFKEDFPPVAKQASKKKAEPKKAAPKKAAEEPKAKSTDAKKPKVEAGTEKPKADEPKKAAPKKTAATKSVKAEAAKPAASKTKKDGERSAAKPQKKDEARKPAEPKKAVKTKELTDNSPEVKGAVAIKEGFFWYYLEEISSLPEILDEKPYPLAGIKMRDLRKCAFRVIVYKNRFAVEFFHSLTDGNGGLIFVKTLTAEYLYQKYGVKVPSGNGILDRLEEPTPDELEDSFIKYAGKYSASRKDTDAYRIGGKREPDGFRTNTAFVIDSDYIRAEAKRRGVTVTVYMTAALIMAAQRVQEKAVRNPARYKPIKICVPVNLRKMFPSNTLRNFVMYVTPGIDPRLGEYGFDDLCQIVAAQIKLQSTKRNMAAIIRANVDSEKNILLRIVPLFIKNIVMKAVFNSVGEKKTCFSFSNLGLVSVPEEYSAHVKRMDFVLGSQASAPYNVSALTYGGEMYLSVTRNASEPVLEREIYGVLRELGVPHTVESNTRGKEKE